MPSNPQFKGVGATKKSNPFPQGKQKVRVFKEPQSMLVNRDSGTVHGTNLTPKEYAKKNFPSAETTKKELKKTYDKEVPYYDSRGSDTLTQLGGKKGKFIKIDGMNKSFHNKRVVATAGKGSKDKDKYSNLDYSKGSKLANLRKRDVNVYMKDHYSWRDSFDFDLEEMTIAQRNSKQNQNKIAAQNRAKEMAKTNIQKFGGTASAAAANKQAMRDKVKVQNNPTQGKPMPSNPQGMRQQGVGKSANDLSRNTTGSSTSTPQEKPVAQTKQLGGRSGAAQRIRAKRESEVTQKPTANTVTQPGGGQTKQMSPEMQRRVAQTQVGDNAAKEVNRINPKPGQTVNTRTNNDGSVSSSVTTKKTIGVDPSAGKSDTKSLVNPNKKQNVKNAKNLKKDFTKVDKQTSSMSIDKEPAAQVDVGKFSGPGGF